VTPELLEVLGFARSLSAKTRGAYDVTVAPLTAAWSYGPAGRRAVPTDAELTALLPQVGWEKLTLDVDRAMLSKSHPKLAIDLGSVLQGYALDKVAEILRRQGQRQGHDQHELKQGKAASRCAAAQHRRGFEDRCHKHEC